MKIAVMGTGGVGGYFGARLAQAGHDLRFIARGAHLAAIRSQGLTVHSPLGDWRVDAPTATDTPADIGPVDVVLFGVKLWDTESAAAAIMPIVGPETMVLSLQNGVVKRMAWSRMNCSGASWVRPPSSVVSAISRPPSRRQA